MQYHPHICRKKPWNACYFPFTTSQWCIAPPNIIIIGITIIITIMNLIAWKIKGLHNFQEFFRMALTFSFSLLQQVLLHVLQGVRRTNAHIHIFPWISSILFYYFLSFVFRVCLLFFCHLTLNNFPSYFILFHTYPGDGAVIFCFFNHHSLTLRCLRYVTYDNGYNQIRNIE